MNHIQNTQRRPSAWLRLAVVLLTAFAAVSCGKDEFGEALTAPSGQGGFALTVCDGGFASADGPQTRAQENGFTTEFTAGDQAGLYAVADDGTLLLANVLVTATAGTAGSIEWTFTAGASFRHTEGIQYFLYYPYQAGGTDQVDTQSTASADGFFQPLIEGWQPKTDQSEYDDYTASDLMVAKGTVGEVKEHVVPLTFSMEHKMALALVEDHGILYHITSYHSKQTLCDFNFLAGGNSKFTDERKKPYPDDECKYTYRYIVHPSQTAVLPGRYPDLETLEYHYFEIAVNEGDITPGNYKRYKVDGGMTEQTGDYHELGLVRTGDLFCPENDDWYLVPPEVEQLADDDEVVGIVFQTYKRRFGTAELAYLAEHGRDKKMHGLVVSTTVLTQNNDAILPIITYGPSQDEGLRKCKTKKDIYNDISGLYNCGHVSQNYSDQSAGETFENHSAFQVVKAFNGKTPVPSNTTGWYLPAAGQMWDVFQHLGKSKELAADAEQTSSENPNKGYQWPHGEKILESLNSWMPGGSEAFITGQNFFTSSESSVNNCRVWCLQSGDNNDLWCYDLSKMTVGYVRPVLAF